MKKLVAIAALLMATTSAHAGGTGITFEIDGQRVHVEPKFLLMPPIVPL
ncbi:MAG: hypothetical protein ACK463_45740 [Bradyrhizobium sp.]